VADALPKRCKTAQVCIEGEVGGEVGTQFRPAEPAILTLRAMPKKWSYLSGHGGNYVIGITYAPVGLSNLEYSRQAKWLRYRCAHGRGGCEWELEVGVASVDFRAWLINQRRNIGQHSSTPVIFLIGSTSQSWSGVWATDYGRMNLTEGPSPPGDTRIWLAGSFEHCAGTLTGPAEMHSTTGSYVLGGQWNVDAAQCPAPDPAPLLLGFHRSEGTFSFSMSDDGCSFIGVWQYPSRGASDPIGGIQSPWNGRKIDPSCPPI
jgi:hypothetical protein